MRSFLCMILLLFGLAPAAGAQAVGDPGQSPEAKVIDDPNVSSELARLLSEYQAYSQSKDALGEVAGQRQIEVAWTAGALQVCTMPSSRDSLGNIRAYCWLNRSQPIWGRATGGTLPYSWSWDFGDGSAPVSGVANTIAEANNISTTHQYTQQGSRTATLTVTDHLGATASAWVEIVVDPCDLDARTNAAIEDGLRRLYLTQQADGRWADYGNEPRDIGVTGAALLTFHLREHFRSEDPCGDIYQGTVSRAIDYLLSKAILTTGLAQGVYPDENGNGRTIRFGTGGWSGYSHGLAMMGLSASKALDYLAPSGPAAGASMRTILEDAVEQCYRAQSKSGSYRGGWRYDINRTDGDADNSVSQWPVLGLLAARDDAGLEIAQQCLSELRYWTDGSQCGDGGFGYHAPNYWCNIGKTGAGILALALLRDRTEDAKVQAALNFINSHWNDAYDPWRWTTEHMNGNLYATYAVAKACRTMKDANRIPVTMIGGHNWYLEYRNYLERQPTECGPLPAETPWRQNPNGSWPDGAWFSSGGSTATAFGLLVLIPAVVECLPVAKAIAAPPAVSCPGDSVDFDGSSSIPCKDRRIVEWLWDFDESDGVHWTRPDASGAFVQYCCYDLPPGRTVKYANLRVKDDNPDSLGGPKFGYDRIGIDLNNENNAPIACLRPRPRCDEPPYSGHVNELIYFDGSASFDPDTCRGDSVACYLWDLDGNGQFIPGGKTISKTWDDEYNGQVGLKVCDTHGLFSTVSIYVNVYSSRKNLKITNADVSVDPPCGVPCGAATLTIHAEVHLETEGGAQTSLVPTAVEFWDGDPLAGGVYIGAQPIPGGVYGPRVFTVDQVWAVTNPDSVHTFFVVVDPQDKVFEWNEETDNVATWTQPTGRPCTGASAVIDSLWPPNHRLARVTIVGVTDARVTGITQDEPLNDGGDGDSCPDGVIDNDGNALVRVERSGLGNGRVYTIHFDARDAEGPCRDSVTVCVPHDQGPGVGCVKDDLVVNSLDQCDQSLEDVELVEEIGLTGTRMAGTVATVEYDLPAEAVVSLAVYDISGRKVAQLENSSRTSGRHQVSFDTAGLRAGIYFYRLQTGRVSLTRSVLILK